MAEAEVIERGAPPLERVKRFVVPAVILVTAALVLWIIAANWNVWGANQASQSTDDAYLRADLTPLSTKVAGTVAAVAVSDYQEVKLGQFLVQLRDDDYRAQVRQAEAAVAGAENALVNNQRQKELQDARILQAEAATHSAEAEIAAAEAGIEAASSAILSAKNGLAAARADAVQTLAERRRQEALAAAESATRQRLEQVVASEERMRALAESRAADLAAASALVASRRADLKRAQAHLEGSKAEVEAQKRQRAVLDSQELLLRADLSAKRAGLEVARTNLDYTRITAPADGVVGERKVRPGQFVGPGAQVLSLVQSDLWVQANFKETQVRHMRAGDAAEIRVDAFPGFTLRGRISQVAPASGSQFALLPPDNATGNFTKIVQRIPVKIILDPGQAGLDRLRAGLSVTATVHTRSGGDGKP
jgi:membrane fusion protein (multidrug efflux system)